MLFNNTGWQPQQDKCRIELYGENILNFAFFSEISKEFDNFSWNVL